MNDDKDFLYRQLDGLGQMIADGLADEPDGKWISKQYRETAIALGIAKPSDFRKPRTNHSKQINTFMQDRLKTVTCTYCNGALEQTRSGALRAKCPKCNKVFILGKYRKTSKTRKR